MRCPQCQQEDWIAGDLGEHGSGQTLDFRPKKSKMFVPSYPTVTAQACRTCGYVTISVDSEKLNSTLKS